MKDVQDWIAVNRLFKQGVRIKQIARQLQMSKNTVKSLIKQKEEPKYIRTKTSTKIDSYKELITIWYTDPQYNFIGTRIFEELNKIGYTGSIGPVYRFLNHIDEEKTIISSKATVRFETPMGDQAQFDWSPYEMDIDNEIKTVYCFSMVLSSSRIKSMVFSLSCNADAIYEAVQELFSDLGGVTRELLIDNPKAFVIEHSTNGEPKYNIDALRLAAHLGVELNACNCYRARTKGKIEKPFQYIEEHFVKGNKFSSMTELNLKAKEFMNSWCQKVHGTTKRIPAQAHLEELKCLLPLPQKMFMVKIPDKRKASLDSLVSVDTRKYSVPVEYADKTVRFRVVYGYRVDIFNLDMSLILSQEILKEKGSILRNEEHYAPIASKAPKSIPEIKRQFTAAFSNGTKYLELAVRHLEQPSFHARQILKLCDMYTNDSLDAVIEYCIDRNIYSIEGFKEVLKSKYFEIALNKGVISLDKTTVTNDCLVRDLSYYEGGGHN